MQRVILLLMHICIVHACEKYSFVKEQDVEFKDHVITTMTTQFVELCWDKCVWIMNCFSINARVNSFGMFECDLNNSSKKASPGSLVPTQGSQYHQMRVTKECDLNGCTIIKEDLGGGWYRINDAAVKIIHENKTWIDARAHCQSLGADLASIKTNYENLFIIDMFSKSMTSKGNNIALPGNDLPDLLKYWALEGTDGDVVLKGTPTPRYDVVDGEKALYFPGLKGYAEVPAVVMNPEGYTFMLWFKPGKNSTNNAENVYSDWAIPKCFRLTLSRNHNSLLFEIYKQEDGSAMTSYYASIDMNGWNHIAVTWKKAQATIRIVLNGTQDSTKTFIPIPPTTHTTYHFGVLGTALPHVYSNKALVGHVRHLMVFNNSMTDQEIQEAMNYEQQGSFWIGLNALNDSSTFKWSDGTSTKNMALPYFLEAPPSYGPRCVAVKKNGKWFDNYCTRLSYFVCGKPFP
ncbi:uncharacterized protein LOC116307881 [Actinia tenebrosa]|uniref:Uncharacterized protein LOC116307881 n=1 Tax=Actinia tenebrosa TaxID=6105 RepID=A0A6P8JBJ7_ACTTE|nr:uncharacterized protein LOC116307881 [Actinia tenebrosa]